MRSSSPQGRADLDSILQTLLAQASSSGTEHGAILGMHSAMRLQEPGTVEQDCIHGEALHLHAFALRRT
jgi:hypothetical protein